MNEEIQMLKKATAELKILRRQNELMRARLDMFDAMNAILHTQVATRNEGMSEDIVWEIENYIVSKERERHEKSTSSIPTPCHEQSK